MVQTIYGAAGIGGFGGGGGPLRLGAQLVPNTASIAVSSIMLVSLLFMVMFTIY